MMRCSASVSVIIPAYNAQACLRRSVEDALKQTLPPLEVIVVDDGSTDQTAEIARGFGNRIRYIHQKNAGSAVARNQGINAAAGEWVAFLDADDLWLPEHLERCCKVLNKDPTLVWCCAAYEAPSGNVRTQVTPPQRWQRLPSTGDGSVVFFDAFLAGAPIQTSGVMVKREVFQAVGLFDPKLRRGQDRDMWYRIALSYPRMGFVWPPTVRYILNKQSVTVQGGDESDRMLEAVARNVARSRDLDAATYASFEGVLRQLARNTCWHCFDKGRPDCLRQLLHEYGRFLSPGQRFVAWCGSHSPACCLRWLSSLRRRIAAMSC